MSDSGTGPRITEEQRIYARVLAAGMYTGLALLLVTFALYVTGVMEPAVPIRDLPAYWGLPVDQYLEAINHDYLQRDHHLTGWWWLSALGYGDYLSFVGVAVLAGVTIVCFAAIVPTLLRNGDTVYAAIAVVEIMVLLLAASGILTAAH